MQTGWSLAKKNSRDAARCPIARIVRDDHFVEQLWNTMQAMPQYRGTTTFMVTTDHGENIWLAVMGPDTPALGERMHTAPVAQAGIAATVAAFMGRDYRAAVPKAAAPIRDVPAGDVPAKP